MTSKTKRTASDRRRDGAARAEHGSEAIAVAGMPMRDRAVRAGTPDDRAAPSAARSDVADLMRIEHKRGELEALQAVMTFIQGYIAKQ